MWRVGRGLLNVRVLSCTGLYLRKDLGARGVSQYLLSLLPHLSFVRDLRHSGSCWCEAPMKILSSKFLKKVACFLINPLYSSHAACSEKWDGYRTWHLIFPSIYFALKSMGLGRGLNAGMSVSVAAAGVGHGLDRGEREPSCGIDCFQRTRESLHGIWGAEGSTSRKCWLRLSYACCDQVGSDIDFTLNLHAFLLISRISSVSSRMTKDVGTSHEDGNLAADWLCYSYYFR